MKLAYVLSRVKNPEAEKPKVEVLSFHPTFDREALEAEVRRLEDRGHRVLGRLEEGGALGVLLTGEEGKVAVTLAPVGFVRREDLPRLALAAPLPA